MFQKITLILLVFFLTSGPSIAQTYFYKRIKIIEKGRITNVNDDAHYVTFSSTGCYDSDENGISSTSSGLKYIKSNKNILCYYGDCIYGSCCYYYVSSSKDRINLENDGVVYVYTKTSPHETTAKLRQAVGQNHKSIIVTKPILNGAGEKTSTSRKQRKTCPYCNGSGKGSDQITYTPNYTGNDNSQYCKICGKVMNAHTHRQPMCRTCFGKGYIEY
ncbi:hypothetical protein [Bacteroides sp.]|uniref:hypothetical protein n=1 Tax=Bacteroides sp. TaxID=29523 RepID=UPI00260DCA95|nr:hypothetical protein [Bacteroides sp.]